MATGVSPSVSENPRTSTRRGLAASRPPAIVASVFGATGGGLVSLAGSTCALIDSLTCTGLFATRERFFRLFWMPREKGRFAELAVYDQLGIVNYCRLDDVRQGHDIAWDGEHVIVVSTGTNEVIWFDLAGRRVRAWTAPGEIDSWHLNSLWLRDDRVLVSAFGKSHKFRGWDASAGERTGVVLDVATGEDVISGLEAPHCPRTYDDGWLICNSARYELLQLDRSGRKMLRSIALEGWTRGIAITERFLFVGESVNRGAARRDGRSTATVAILDRETWTVVERIALPGVEVYDLVAVEEPLLEGLRAGFRNSPQRSYDLESLAFFREAGHAHAHLWRQSDPLARSDCKVRVIGDLRPVLEVASFVEISCEIVNCGRAIWYSTPPYPVNVSYRWLAPGGKSAGETEGIRTALPRPLAPNEKVSLRIEIRTPERPGEYELSITLVQEQIAWFSDIAAENAFVKRVTIVQRDPIDNHHSPVSDDRH